MNNKYISSFVGVLVLVSSFLFWFNTNSVTDDPVEVKKVTIQETTTTAIEETTKTAVDETVTKVTIQETTTTTELIPISKIAVSEDSESVQIISNEEDEVESQLINWEQDAFNFERFLDQMLIFSWISSKYDDAKQTYFQDDLGFRCATWEGFVE